MRFLTVNSLEARPEPRQHVVLSEDEEKNQALMLMLSIRRELERLRKKLYNHTHPIDEYHDIPSGSSGRLDFQPMYDRLSSRYESIMYSLGVGTTSAVLTLGKDRNITLYSGAALATQLVGTLPFLGIILNPDDERFVITAGATTSSGHIALAGHCLGKDSDD